MGRICRQERKRGARTESQKTRTLTGQWRKRGHPQRGKGVVRERLRASMSQSSQGEGSKKWSVAKPQRGSEGSRWKISTDLPQGGFVDKKSVREIRHPRCREEIQNGGRCELLCLGWRGWRKIKEVATESWFPRGQQGVQGSARGEVVAGSGPPEGQEAGTESTASHIFLPG